MKKFKNLILVVLLSFSALGLFSYTQFEGVANSEKTEISEPAACNFGQCTATAKSTGQRCKHCVSKSGDSKCYQHK